MEGTLMAIVLALTIGQATTTQAGQAYAGTWIAEHAGTTYVRLELEAAARTLRGRVSLGNIQFDAQGVVNKAEPAPRELTPIRDVNVRTTFVSFTRRDSNDTDHFEMRLLGNDVADLLLIPKEEDRKELTAIGVGVLKPIRLRKLAR